MFSPKSVGGSRGPWIVVLVNALLIGGIVVLFEVTGRLIGVTPESFRTRSHMRFGMEASPRGYFVAHDGRGFDIASNSGSREVPFREGTVSVFSNNYGCFHHREGVEPDYVLLLGDSFAWG